MKRIAAIIVTVVVVLAIAMIIAYQNMYLTDRIELKRTIYRLTSIRTISDFRKIKIDMSYKDVVSLYGQFDAYLDESGSNPPLYYLRNGDRLVVYFVDKKVYDVSLYGKKGEYKCTLLTDQFRHRLIDLQRKKIMNQSMLPLSGFEIAYDQKLWGYVNNIYLYNYTSSYNYALNIRIDPRNGKYFKDFSITKNRSIFGLKPGEFAGIKLKPDYSNIVECCIADAKKMGYTFKAIEETAKASKGNYKVALVVSHKHGDLWYKQNPDGTWSYKNKDWPIEDKDFDGDIIYNPREANSGNDAKFIGFFEVGGTDKIGVSQPETK